MRVDTVSVMRRRLLAAVLAGGAACVLVATGPAGAAPAAEPPIVTVADVPSESDALVETAQAEVTDLQAAVDAVAAELTAGTVRLEAGQAKLAETQARAAQAQVEADLARAAADEAKARLGRVVGAAYQAPRLNRVTLALSTKPGSFGEAVLADAELDNVRGNAQDLLVQAREAGAAADRKSAEAQALRDQAAGEERVLAEQVAALTARAGAVRTRLEQAQARLQSAQLAVADETARKAALAKTLADISGGAALCTQASTAGYPNGFLPPEVLCPIAVGGGQRLRADAAAAFNALLATKPVCVTDSYRSYGAQVDVYARKPGLAAVPGTSNHGWGVALDLCGGVETFGTPMYEWMRANAPKYGWIHPAWAEPGGSRPEPWHWEFIGLPTPKSASPPVRR